MYSKILLAIDGSDPSRRALDEACRVAVLSGARVHAVYVVDKWGLSPYAGYYDPEALGRVLHADGHGVLHSAREVLAKQGVECDTEIDETHDRSDDVAHCLQRCAQRQGAELVVMGTHGKRGLRKAILGSVAERLLHMATCPVLLVRSDASSETGRV
ncbi:nucleotide-binding universal stress UspA family protein [Paraburkholderia sp. GAS448]|uniref:universal stress protein n=1 Tax=Paraburkholderia sp. GAS448 TaxID=3035136 RepID=UPI003D236F73